MKANYNINLIKDRAEQPPTLIERLSFTITFCLVFAYATTLGLALLVFQTLNREDALLQMQIEGVERLRERPVHTERYEMEEATLELINAVDRMARKYEQRMLWHNKIDSLQQRAPQDLFIKSFIGQADRRIEIKGYADNTDGRGRQRIRDFVEGVDSDEDFMRLVRDVRWESSSRSAGPFGMDEVLEFDIVCPTK